MSIIFLGKVLSKPNQPNDEWHVVHAKNLKDETKLIEAGFEYIRYSQKDDVAIYRKRK